MAGTSDRVFLRVFKWFQATVSDLEADIPATGPAALAAPLADALRTRLGLELNKTANTIDPEAFAATRAEAESLAIAALITGETLAALKTVGELLSDIGNGNLGLRQRLVRTAADLAGQRVISRDYFHRARQFWHRAADSACGWQYIRDEPRRWRTGREAQQYIVFMPETGHARGPAARTCADDAR